jgi:hypothetical protein
VPKVKTLSGSSSSAGGHEAAAAPASVNKRRAASRQVITADKRHWLMAMARAVKTMTKRATKKARGTRGRAMRARVTGVRATRAMAETSSREEGDDGQNN